MPAWPKLKVRLLADLAEQLRFAPKPAVVKDISRAIRTMDIVDPSQNYPSDWVIFRITGYREDGSESSTIPGAALKSDLPRLVERLSAQTKLRAEDLAELGPGLSQQQLIAEWKVNRKTLERYRSKGLLALRLLGSRGKSFLFFPASSTARFREDHASSFKQAAAFSRVGEAESGALISRARKIAARSRVSRTRIASHLARRAGRARGTLDRLLKPVLTTGKSRKRIGPAALPRILERWDRGQGVGDIAKFLKKSRATAIRSISLARADRLERWDPIARIPPDYSALEPPGSLEEIAETHPLAASAICPPHEQNLQSLLDAMSLRELMPREEEREFILAHHSCMLFAARNRAAPIADNLDAAETALRWAAKLRAALIRPHRAVIVESLDSLTGISVLSADPALLTAALMHGVRAAAESLELFTPSESNRREIGGRLAAPTALAANKALAEWSKANERQLAQLKSRQDPNRAARSLSAIAIPDWTDQVSPWQSALSPERVRTPREDLSPELTAILRLRSGWRADRPHTIKEIAKSLRLTRIRTAQRLQQALRASMP